MAFMAGTSGNNTIRSLFGGGSLNGLPHATDIDDQIPGNAGNDTLIGGVGNDATSSGRGQDSALGNARFDINSFH